MGAKWQWKTGGVIRQFCGVAWIFFQSSIKQTGTHLSRLLNSLSSMTWAEPVRREVVERIGQAHRVNGPSSGFFQTKLNSTSNHILTLRVQIENPPHNDSTYPKPPPPRELTSPGAMELLLYSLRSMGLALLQNYKHALSSMYIQTCGQ